MDELETEDFTLSPGRYVDAPETEEDRGAFEERVASLVDLLADEFAENQRLATEVKSRLQQPSDAEGPSRNAPRPKPLTRAPGTSSRHGCRAHRSA
jgi:hypothetical protein